MGKRRYRARKIQDVSAESLVEALGEQQRVVIAVDVAKEDFFAAVVSEDKSVVAIVKWQHPAETPAFVRLCVALKATGVVDVAMEPSGSYGDALRYQLLAEHLRVFRVNPKKTFDAKEVYDGVPSLHDAKSAAVIGWLHQENRSEPWPAESREHRVRAAALAELELHEKAFDRHRNRLEAVLARYWPGLDAILAPGSATVLALACKFGSPAAVTQRPADAEDLMRRVGRSGLAKETIDAVLASAAANVGVPMLPAEVHLVQCIAEEAERSRKLRRQALRVVEGLVAEQEGLQPMAAAVGKRTAVVLVAALGEPERFESARAYEKTAGLNLREKSSGRHRGGLHITKRGSGVARKYLYFAVLRLMQTDPVIKAWYARKVKRQGGQAKTKAIVAIMRKLVRALWHVGQGAEFDSRLLYDVRRLKLEETA